MTKGSRLTGTNAPRPAFLGNRNPRRSWLGHLQGREAGGGRLVVTLLVAAYALLTVAWLVGNPPGSAPDEPSHFVKALAAGRGELTGHPVNLPGPAPTTVLGRFNVALERSYQLPPGQTEGFDGSGPPVYPCDAFQPTSSAACLNGQGGGPRAATTRAVSSVGTYQPFLYVLPGLAMRPFSASVRALRVGRLVMAILSLGLLAVTAALLWAPRSWDLSLIGLLVAVTPMVVFVGSTLTTSGVEIVGSMCFFAALLRLDRDGEGSRHALWWAIGVSGVLLAVSRPTGVIWIVLEILILVGLRGVGRPWRTWREGGWASLSATAAVVLACAATVAWQETEQPHSPGTVVGLLSSLWPALGALPQGFTQAIGVFGWVDTVMPVGAYLAWALILAAVVFLSLLVTKGRQRWALVGTMVGVVITCAGISSAFNFQLGEGAVGIQGRWLLPILATVPLLAGELLWRNRARLGVLRPQWLFAGVAIVAGAVQLLGWLVNARRYAVGTKGPTLFFLHSAWSPPLGWLPWMALATLGAVSLVGVGGLSTRPSGESASALDHALAEPPPVVVRREHEQRV